jgi:DNA-binding transcriptional regulator YhcF (GntR family)
MSPIELDHTSAEPKYQQVISFIKRAIDNYELKLGDKIPSVNEVAESTGIAKKTVVQAFEQLNQAGIIHAVQYKGYFVASRNTQSKHNIFLLFNNLSAYKEEIYESIKSTLNGEGVVDIFFHHDNVKVFDTLVEESAGKYTEYIIMPINNRAITKSLQLLPKNKVYILDLGYTDWGKKYPSVCQFFEDDIYEALKQGLQKIKKYEKIILVIGDVSKYNTAYTEKGFLLFCKEFGFKHELLVHVEERTPKKGELYIAIEDSDLVQLVKKANELALKLGKDIGIISYNEIPIKEVVANGIATISTDFKEMGKSIIELILEKRNEHLKNPGRLIDRPSF